MTRDLIGHFEVVVAAPSPGAGAALSESTSANSAEGNGTSNFQRSCPAALAMHVGAHTGDPDFMMSLARGLQVVHALSLRTRPCSVSQLSAATGLARAVVRRCLHTLTRLGCTERDGRRQYSLVPHALNGVIAGPRR